MLNTTAALSKKVIVHVVKNMSVNSKCVVLRWAEHKDSFKQSKPAKHLKYFSDHQFEW